MVGCGDIIRKHLVSINRIDNAEIVAVCDQNEEKASQIGKDYNLPWFSNAHDMARACDFDVFTILTPSGTHASQVLELVPYHRHFVVEKPLALRIEDADKVLESCDINGIKIFVVKQNRFNLPIVKLKEAIDAGRFGKLVMGTIRMRWCRTQSYYDARKWRGTWAQDGGVLTNQASHHIDLLSWLLGNVDSVMAMTSTRLAKIEAEDTGIAILRFINGSLGLIEATTATRPKDLEGSISILGEKGSVEIGGHFANELKTWCFVESTKEDENIFTKWGSNPNEFAWNHTEYLKNVVHSLTNNRRGLVDGIEGRKSLELINAIYESAETGQEVRLRFRPKNCKLGQVYE